MNRSFVLALDIGTSSVRSALYDHRGDVLPETMVKNERVLTVTADGGAEIDADEAFDQVVTAVDDVLQKTADLPGEISHVAGSAFWHSLLGIDPTGRPTTKVLGWADTRSRAQVVALRKRFTEDEVHDRTGARFHSSFWPAKLLWLRREFPKVYKRTEMWLSFSDYAALKLFGSPTTSVSMASATGLFDIRKCIWDRSLIRFLGVRKESLPAIPVSDSASFALTPAFRKRWRRLKDTHWFPAIGDGAANNIGAGCVSRSKAALMIGTSGAMRVAYEGEPPKKIPSGLWCYRIDRSRVIMGGALSDGGGLYRWLNDNLRLLEDDDKTESQIDKRKPDGHGLTFLPFISGERSTGYHENARGAIVGLQSATDSIDIVRAALESVAYRFAEIFAQLNSVAEISEIVASGGALRESPVWTQIICDVLERNLRLPATREASSRGAVLLALETIGKIQDIGEVKGHRSRLFKASRKTHNIYRAARKRHEEIYELLSNKIF